MKIQKSGAGSGQAITQCPPDSPSQPPAWKLTFPILLTLLVVFSWYPALRTFSRFDGGFNEGFNSYFQQTAQRGGAPYEQPPVYFYANYPPLSFLLAGWLAVVVRSVNLAGRLLSLLALLSISVSVGLTVKHYTGQVRHALFAASCWLIWLSAFDEGRLGFNDPHLLGLAFSAAGFYLFVRHQRSTRWLIVSAVVFSISLFTKQTLLTFPAAVATELWLTSRKRCLIWLGTAVVACLAFLGLTFAFEGRYFLEHLKLPRTYSFAEMWANVGQYLTFAQIPFVLAVIWIVKRRAWRDARVVVVAGIIGHVFGAFVAGGKGAGVNHLFDGLIALAMLGGLALPTIESIAATWSYPRAAALSWLLPFFLSSVIALPQRISYDVAFLSAGHTLQSDFTRATAFLRSRNGPALCETLLLCFEAGKPEEFDAFAVDQAVKTGHLPESQVLQLISSRRFAAVEVDFPADEPIHRGARLRFSEAFMTQLFASYRPVYRDSRYVIFVPGAAPL